MVRRGPVRASRLRQRSEGKGYTLEEVKGSCGLCPPYLSRVECGTPRLRPEKKVATSRPLSVKVAGIFDVEPLADRAVS